MICLINVLYKYQQRLDNQNVWELLNCLSWFIFLPPESWWRELFCSLWMCLLCFRLCPHWEYCHHPRHMCVGYDIQHSQHPCLQQKAIPHEGVTSGLPDCLGHCGLLRIACFYTKWIHPLLSRIWPWLSIHNGHLWGVCFSPSDKYIWHSQCVDHSGRGIGPVYPFVPPVNLSRPQSIQNTSYYSSHLDFHCCCHIQYSAVLCSLCL